MPDVHREGLMVISQMVTFTRGPDISPCIPREAVPSFSASWLEDEKEVERGYFYPILEMELCTK